MYEYCQLKHIRTDDRSITFDCYFIKLPRQPKIDNLLEGNYCALAKNCYSFCTGEIIGSFTK